MTAPTEAELEAQARAASRLLNLSIDAVCMPGVIVNLGLIFSHASAFLELDLPDATDPAALIAP